MASSANSIEIAATAADVAVLGSGAKVRGFCLTEAAGTPAAASCIIRDGANASAEVVFSLKFAASETKTAWFGDGITFDTGVFLDMVAGTIQGSIFVS